MAARQQITRDWFARGAEARTLFVSQLVIREASAGDEEAARERLTLLKGIPLLAILNAAGELAAKLVGVGAVPRQAMEDALHINGHGGPRRRLLGDLELQAHRERHDA